LKGVPNNLKTTKARKPTTKRLFPVEETATMGWCKPSRGAKYADQSLKGFRGWFRDGLRHVRLPNGRILTKFHWIDEYIRQFEITDKTAEAVAEELVEGL
jgi:hypothetical protein